MLLTVRIRSRQMRRIAVRGAYCRSNESGFVPRCPDMRVLAAAHTEVGRFSTVARDFGCFGPPDEGSRSCALSRSTCCVE